MISNKVPARHFEKIAGTGSVRCLLCSHRCVIAPGKKGFCRSRANDGGTLFALNYARACAVNMDPVEKKPLYHFLPSTSILSIGTNFCNFSCRFCQNYEISQHETPTVEVSGEKLVELIRAERECFSLAYTYNEPIIWYEFVSDTARLVRENSFKTVLVTNGDISGQAFDELAPHIDAMNIDLKAFDSKFYSEICSGSLESVCATIENAYGHGIIVELTNLVIPGLNDSDAMIRRLVDFAASVSPDIPIHFSKYHPAYRMNIAPTPVASLERAYSIASEKMKYVYVGNVPDRDRSSTYCPGCGKTLIRRLNYGCDPGGITREGKCRHCGEKIYGIFYNCGD